MSLGVILLLHPFSQITVLDSLLGYYCIRYILWAGHGCMLQGLYLSGIDDCLSFLEACRVLSSAMKASQYGGASIQAQAQLLQCCLQQQGLPMRLWRGTKALVCGFPETSLTNISTRLTHFWHSRFTWCRKLSTCSILCPYYMVILFRFLSYMYIFGDFYSTRLHVVFEMAFRVSCTFPYSLLYSYFSLSLYLVFIFVSPLSLHNNIFYFSFLWRAFLPT